MMDLSRLLSRPEAEAFKSANRATRRAILRGRRIRQNSALDEKIRSRAAKAKRKEKRKARLERKRLREQQSTPIIRTAP